MALPCCAVQRGGKAVPCAEGTKNTMRDQIESKLGQSPLFQIVFGFYLIYAHKVFDEMAARKFNLNLGKNKL